MGTHRFEMEAPAPFRLDLTVWALRRRAHNSVDGWDGRSWRRVVTADDAVALMSVRQEPDGSAPLLVVELELPGGHPSLAAGEETQQLVAWILSLDLDLSGFYALAGGDPRLAALAERFVGMRPPRFSSVFEALVNAVACQQLSLAVGIHLLNRLAARFGIPPAGPDSAAGLPSPAQLGAVDPAELQALGFSRNKARALMLLARQVSTGEIDLAAVRELDDPAAVKALTGLAGIGRWSAEYALLRGLGRLQILPGDDVGARNGLRRRFGLPSDGGYDSVAELARGWWPYAGLVYFHLLLDGLAAAGHLPADVSDPIRPSRPIDIP